MKATKAEKKRGMQLFDLLNMDSPAAVLDETLMIFKMISAGIKTETIASAFNLTVALYAGNYPGYRACNTGFHDFLHTAGTLLAMARLMHGATLAGENFSKRQVVLALITALLHDAGYLQEDRDNHGTGAKYFASHVQRSMDFLKRNGKKYGLSDKEIEAGRAIIHCTDLFVDMHTIEFPNPETELLGKMLGTADLLAQMADRNYLEKLLHLYKELSEGNVGDYKDEIDLLNKTVSYYESIAQRLKEVLGSTDRFMAAHFVARWNIHTDLYQESIENQIYYLLQILAQSTSDPRKGLRRKRVMDKFRKKIWKKTE